MTHNDTVQHRTYYQPAPDRMELRQSDEADGLFSVRLPIASTGEVRNEGDDPLSGEEIAGMGQQIGARAVGVFLDHGQSDVAGSRYSAVEKVGEWADAETEQRDGETELVATARLMDPETLPDATGSLREALTSLKEQVKRDMSLSSSIGWRDDRSAPGGVDLMEASIVGIPADPRTTSQDADPATVIREAGGQAGAVTEEPTASRRARNEQLQQMWLDDSSTGQTVTEESTTPQRTRNEQLQHMWLGDHSTGPTDEERARDALSEIGEFADRLGGDRHRAAHETLRSKFGAGGDVEAGLRELRAEDGVARYDRQDVREALDTIERQRRHMTTTVEQRTICRQYNRYEALQEAMETLRELATPADDATDGGRS